MNRLQEFFSSAAYRSYSWRANHVFSILAVAIAVVGFVRHSPVIKATAFLALFSCGIAYLMLYLTRTPSDRLRNHKIVVPLLGLSIAIVIVCVAILNHLDDFARLLDR